MRLGIGSWTYGWAVGVPGYETPAQPLDSFALVERACSLSVDVVQIADNLPVDLLKPDAIERLAETARRACVTLELGTRGLETKRLAAYLDLAGRLNASLVRTLIPGEMTFAEAEDAIRGSMAAYERAGVTLAIENYEKHPAAELAQLVARLRSVRLGICLDTVNSLGRIETPDEACALLVPFAVNVHVKDFAIKRVPSMMGYAIEGRPAGQGQLDIPALIADARGNGRDPNIIIEQWTPFQGDVERTIALEADWAQQSVLYLRSVMAARACSAQANQRPS
jgi:sugar phosphate isomerase/epimerase